MSHKANDVIAEDKREFAIESDLFELGNILRRSSSRGVDKRIIADIIINNNSYLDIGLIYEVLGTHLTTSPMLREQYEKVESKTNSVRTD